MADLVPIRRALLSVSDKTGLIAFARALADRGIELISTGGTGRALADAGLSVIPVEKVTGFPEIMDGRVKTLHPNIHGAILARRDDPAHVEAMREHDITPIDLIGVNLYPFERTQREKLPDPDAIELIDIGGPSMIRSAAKNYEFVTVVVEPDQYERVVTELDQREGAISLPLRRELAAEAFARTAQYDAMIASWMARGSMERFPRSLVLTLRNRRELRYGENPHQRAALYADPDSANASVVAAEVLHGKALSYNNLNDVAAAFDLARELRFAFPERAGAIIVKHANPCGAAIASDAHEAFIRAYAGDPLAAYGGILALNAPVDRRTAQHICEGDKFFEVIAAPFFDDDARALVAERWKNIRLLAAGPIAGREERGSIEVRSLRGGYLVQEADSALPEPSQWKHVAGPLPRAGVLESAAFIWLIAKHLKSNAVAIGAACQLLGAGAGQMDRVASARIAVEKTQAHQERGETLVGASDGFFPFADAPEILIDADVSVIVQPGGSKRDQDTIDLCNARGVTLLMTGVRHFKH